jgi:acyl dehydratase
MNKITDIQRGRELVARNQLVEAAAINLLLAMVNPHRPGETVRARVERTKQFLLEQIVEAGFSVEEADELIREAHAKAYVEFMKV